MAVYIPIISEFKSTGVDRAIKEFKSLEKTSDKMAFAIKKAAVPAAAALAGVGYAALDAAKAAIEDAAAQNRLANNIEQVTKATKSQIASNEDWISTQGRNLGVADDELRPALSRLVLVTKDLTKAQDLASLAMDIAAARGVSLATATNALEKAAGGNTKALVKLDPALKGVIDKTTTLDEATKILTDKYAGSAAEAAETTAGKFGRLSLSLNETKESIGAALIPIIEKALPYLQSFAAWAERNPKLLAAVAAGVAAVAAAIVAAQIAIAVSNPFTLIALGITALIAGIVYAYNKFEWFRDGVKTVLNFLIGAFERFLNSWIRVINGVIRGYNAIPLAPNLSLISEVSFGRIGEAGPVAENAMVTNTIGARGTAVGTSPTSASSAGSTTYIIQGAVDPSSTARQIQQLQDNQDARFGWR